MSTQHLLITGGSGFIGRHLCRRLQDAGYVLHVLTRDKGHAAQRLPAGIHLYSELAELDAATHFYGVVNLAGAPLAAGRWNNARKHGFYSSRIGMTNALYRHFVQALQPPKVLINGSAIGYYGPNGDQPLDEDGTATDCFSHQLCNAWERSAKSFASIGCRVCCLRIGVVLGPEEGALARMLPSFKMGLGGRLGSGRQWFSWFIWPTLSKLFTTAWSTRKCVER